MKALKSTPLTHFAQTPALNQKEHGTARGRKIRTRTLPFARPDITEAEIAAVNRVLRSGWLTAGPETARFEEEFAAATGAKHAVALNSATAALHLGTTTWNLGPNDAVLVPAITFTATAEIITYSGATPLIVDVGRDDYLLNADILNSFVERSCVRRKTGLVHKKTGKVIRGMIPVHLGGRPCPMNELGDFARTHNLHVMEDAAHAFPCSYGKRPVGSISESTAFSFYATKNLTTGEGGMLTTNIASLAKRAQAMRLHGIKGQTYGRRRWNYDVVEAGYKYNMTDIAAAMGRVQLSRSIEMLERRRNISALYRAALHEIPGIRMMPESPHEQAHHLFTIEIGPETGMSRDRFVEELYARGIATSLHFIPLYRHTYYRKKYRLSKADYPNSEKIYSRILSLPLSSSMTDDDAKDVIRSVFETAVL